MPPHQGPVIRTSSGARRLFGQRRLLTLNLAVLALLIGTLLFRMANDRTPAGRAVEAGMLAAANDLSPAPALAAADAGGDHASSSNDEPAQATTGGATRTARAYTIQEFLTTTSLAGAAYSPDHGNLLVSSDQTGVFNAFAIPSSGGAPVQLTHSTGSAVFTESYFPGDERFLYHSDEGGNELDHLYVRELDGSARDLTPGKQLKAMFVGWAADQRSFFARTNERDARFFDLYEFAVEGYARSLVYQDTTGYEAVAISADKRWLALQQVITTTDNNLLLLDRETHALRPLTPHRGDVVHEPVDFSRDGRLLYYITDAGSEFSYLAKLDLKSGNSEMVVKPDWDVMFAQFSRSGRYCVLGVNADARTRIELYRVEGWQPVALPELPAAEITAVKFSDDERALAFYASTSRLPKDLFACELGSSGATQLTRSLNPAIDPGDLAEPAVVRFKSYDGLEIPGILYRPYGASAQHPAPALVWVHGGPGGQSRVGYQTLVQYLVNHGYAIFAINNRGSSGYGKTFFKADDRKHGEADLQDCVASKRMLVDTGWVDGDRIGILGGSYGGYMVLAALAFTPDQFAVGVDLFGVANWVRTLQSIPPWWESFRKALFVEMGDPAVDGERLHRISPLFSADQIRQPLLVLQGKNDPRVLKQESDDIVAAARKNGATVEYVVFDDEGHGFVKKANTERGYQAVLDFLEQHLKNARKS